MIISVRNAKKCHNIPAVISLLIVRTRFKVHWYPLKLEFFPFCTQLHTTWESPVAMPSRQMFSLLRGARGSVFLLALWVCRLSKGAPLPSYNPPLPPNTPHTIIQPNLWGGTLKKQAAETGQSLEVGKSAARPSVPPTGRCKLTVATGGLVYCPCGKRLAQDESGSDTAQEDQRDMALSPTASRLSKTRPLSPSGAKMSSGE